MTSKHWGEGFYEIDSLTLNDIKYYNFGSLTINFFCCMMIFSIFFTNTVTEAYTLTFNFNILQT